MNHTAGAGPLADFTVGQRVMTVEGYPGTVTDIHEGPADLTTIFVSLDNAMGGGEYAEAELTPIAQQQGSLSAAVVEAGVEHTAADDYPELGSILTDRLPPALQARIAARKVAHPHSPYLLVWVSMDGRHEAYFDDWDDAKAMGMEIAALGSTVPNALGPEIAIEYQNREYSSGVFDYGNLFAVILGWEEGHTAAKTASYTDTVLAQHTDACVEALEEMSLENYVDAGGINPWEGGGINHEAYAAFMPFHRDSAANFLDSSPDEFCSCGGKTANRLSDVAQAAQTHADSLPRCDGCGQAYHSDEIEGDLHDHWTADFDGLDFTSTKTGAGGCGEGDCGCSTAPEGRTALYLPPVPKSEQRASTSDITPGQKAGYDEGFTQGKGGVTREPSNPGDQEFMVGYDLGWAEGVTVAREPANSWDMDDLGADQTAGIPPSSGAPFGGGMMAALDRGYEHTDSERVLLGMPLSREAGEIKDWLKNNGQPGNAYSYDWCRFRRNSHCFLPKSLNADASARAGYAVWEPMDRGICWRAIWDVQKKCPTSMPGPHANGYTDATVAWEDGGQRNGTPGPVSSDAAQYGPNVTPGGLMDTSAAKTAAQANCPVCGDTMLSQVLGMTCMMCGSVIPRVSFDSLDLPYTSTASMRVEASFEFTATWKDVQAKAKRIRAAGGVRLVAHQDNVVVGHIKGDNAVYETEIVSMPGKRNAASWSCGCKWSGYSWGRSGPWKKFEGRMCSHALALQYETQSRGFGGKALTLDEKQPAWMDGKPLTHSSSLHVEASPVDDRLKENVAKATTLEAAAKAMLALARREEPKAVSDIQTLCASNHGEMVGLDFRFKSEGSLLRKMKAESAFFRSPGECARNMSDTLRFTVLFPPENYTEDTEDVLSGLNGRGYKTRVKNYWGRGDAYNGVNVALTTPSGHPCELQFHTEASFLTKEKDVHPIYEAWRTESDPNIKAILGHQMRDIFDMVPRPPGSIGIDELKRQPMVPWKDINWFPNRKAASADGYRYLALHKIDNANVPPSVYAVLRVTDASSEVWENGQWLDDPEFGRYSFLGDPTSDEITEDEAHLLIGTLSLQAVSHHRPVLAQVDDEIPSTEVAGQMLAEGQKYTAVREMLLSAGVSAPAMVVASLRNKAFKARVDGEFVDVDINADGFHDQTGAPIDPASIVFPKWHPTLGLNPEDEKIAPEAANKDTSVGFSEHGDERLKDAGVSVKKTDKGKYYVHTHRARGKDRDSVSDIPDSEIEAIEATGSRHPFEAVGRGEGWLVNGKPYTDGVWIEVEPDKWYRGAVGSEIPSSCYVSLSEGKWEWMARVSTFIGAPHENRAGAKGPARGSSKTLEQAQEKALASLAKDQEFFDRYQERMRAKGLTAAKDQQVEVSGVVLLAADTGRILMLQRALSDDDPASGTWEFPGGHHEDGDTTSLHAAIREWEEEVGQTFPEGGTVTHTWTSADGIYQGHLVVIPEEADLALHEARTVDNPDGDDFEQAAWWAPDDAKKNPALRTECGTAPWAKFVAPGKTAALTKTADEDQCPRCGEDSCPNATRHDGVLPNVYDCPECNARFMGHEVLADLTPSMRGPLGEFWAIPHLMMRNAKTTTPKEGSKMDIADEFGSLFDTAAAGISPVAAIRPEAVGHEATDWGLDPTYEFDQTSHWNSVGTPHPGLGHTMDNSFVDSPVETIDEDPQAALPVTYGDDETEVAQQLAAALHAPTARTAANVVCPKCQTTFVDGQDIEVKAGVGLQHRGTCPPALTTARRVAPAHQETAEEKGRRLLAYVDASLSGEQVSGPDPFAHIGAGQADNELAGAAQNYLATKGAGIQTEALKTYDPRERQAIIDEGIEVRATNLDRLDIAGTHYEALEASHTAARSEDEDLTFLDGDPNLGDFE